MQPVAEGRLCVPLRTALGALALVSVVGSASSKAFAQEAEQPIRITFRAPEGCPDEGSFFARVRARASKARPAQSGPEAMGARAFDVEMDSGPPASGRVAVGDRTHPDGVRRVEAATCAEVADALALVIALAIEPGAAPPATAPTPIDQRASRPPADPPIAPPAASATVSPGLRSPSPATSAPAREAQARPSPARPNERRSLLVGLDAAVDVGVSPAALFGLSPYVGWQSKSTALFAPALRVAFDRARSGVLAVPNGTAAFTWTVGRVDACPFGKSLASVRISACARLEAGALEVAGGDIVNARGKTRAWVAAGALARAEWTFLEPFFVEVEAAGVVRATDDRFVFLPDTTVYHVPLVGAGAGAGFGAHFL